MLYKSTIDAKMITSVQSNLARGRIAVLPSRPSRRPNAFVRCVHWAGTVARGWRNALVSCSKMPLPMGNLYPHLIHLRQPLKQHLGSVPPFLHSSPVRLTHRHTNHAKCEICSNRPHLIHWVQVMRPSNTTMYDLHDIDIDVGL